MEFFNKKEEVIDLKLTQYGKYLLSLGQFKPTYYAFYDEEILYDSNYGGISEDQNSSEPRIQENTPSLKLQHLYHSIDDEMLRASQVQELGYEKVAAKIIQPTPEKTQTLQKPLGHSRLGSNKTPAWQITALGGKILTASTEATLTLSGSETILEIPQIEAEIKYTVSIEQHQLDLIESINEGILSGELDDENHSMMQDLIEQSGGENFDELSYEIKVYEDGSYFAIDADQLILEIVEEHAPMSNKNFEIEVFEREDKKTNKTANTTTVTKLNQLSFISKPELVVNNILLDEDESYTGEEPAIDTSCVDYYFDVEVDGEIDPLTICNKLQNADLDEYKFAFKDFRCEDFTQSAYKFLSPYAEKDDETGCGET